jgi:hypothetical protein
MRDRILRSLIELFFMKFPKATVKKNERRIVDGVEAAVKALWTCGPLKGVSGKNMKNVLVRAPFRTRPSRRNVRRTRQCELAAERVRSHARAREP